MSSLQIYVEFVLAFLSDVLFFVRFILVVPMLFFQGYPDIVLSRTFLSFAPYFASNLDLNFYKDEAGRLIRKFMKNANIFF